MMTTNDEFDGARRARVGAETADATDASARLWRDAGAWIRGALPTEFTVLDLRDALASYHLIANDGSEELRCLGAWPRKLGARKIGTRTVTPRKGGHASHRAVWSLAPSPLTQEPSMSYAEDARAILGDKGELLRALAAQTLRLETARAALRQIADTESDHACRDYAHSQWALTDPNRSQTP